MNSYLSVVMQIQTWCCSHEFCLKYVRDTEEKTYTHAVRLHSNSVGNVRENVDGVSSVLAINEAVALEVKAVDVGL